MSGKPPIDERPYRVIFEGNFCFGAGLCAEVSPNWSMQLDTRRGKPGEYFFDEEELAHNLEAARVCPAKKRAGAIHIIDRRTGKELAPDPFGDGTVSLG